VIRRVHPAVVVALFLVLSCATVRAQDTPPPGPRFAISAGMGVNYISPGDVVDMINGAFKPAQKVGQFHAGADFFGSLRVRLSEEWAVTAEYAYLLNSYNIESGYGPGEFMMTVHMPTLLAHYLFVSEPYYDLGVGGGIGYHFGTLAIKYGTIDEPYTGSGPGIMFALTGNTALGERAFVHLEGNLRWEFIGDVRNAAGKSPGVNAQGAPVTLDSFSAGVRIGMTFLL
jgi:hypothetical protein